MQIMLEPHPMLRAAAFETRFAAPLGAMSLSDSPGQVLVRQRLAQLLSSDAAAAPADRPAAPMARDEAVRQAVRDMLRVGGYKPTGRGKPASEYLVRAAEAGSLGSINVAVDTCNAVSLHSGFPISVVDTASARAPYRIAIARPGTRYIFNSAGQEIDVAGLVCLFDAEGACANAVRDSQRTKTREDTTSTLSVIWGVAGQEDRLMRAAEWYRALLHDAGSVTTSVTLLMA
jgi:DNA/RNA-binding domain of Phe-tRNA-synthetase-like protein